MNASSITNLIGTATVLYEKVYCAARDGRKT